MASPNVTVPSSHSRPLVSIGLPVYNGAKYLARALDALTSQDWAPLEIVISDNASTDDSVAIAESYAARDSRIRVIRADVNAGFEANFAEALAATKGAYFMWAACDDWWHPQFVSRLVQALERTPGAVVAMSAVERVDETGQVMDVVRFNGERDPARLTGWRLTMQLAGGRPYHLFIYGLYRRDFLARAFSGFAPVIASDRLLVCRIAMGGRFAYVDDVLHRRLIRSTPIAERYAGEALGQLWRGTAPRWRLAMASGPYLWRSPVLPISRRWWVPAVTFRFFKAAIGHTLAQIGRPGSSVKIAASTRGARSHR